MISKTEILEKAKHHGLRPQVVEKDYVLGWLLAGIHQSAFAKSWVFKGGTCLKKCYFNTFRFSEDLDFTLKDSSQLDEHTLQNSFADIAEWIYQHAGIDIPPKRIEFEVYVNPRGGKSCQGKIYYCGPVTSRSPKAWPRIKLDLTADEVLVDKTAVRKVGHTYSDVDTTHFFIQCYCYAELFAEKTRALAERTRPRDLFDVIHFFRRPESENFALDVRRILQKKCDFKSMDIPTIESLDQHKAICQSGWKNQLEHQVPVLPSFESFWDELAEFFNWLHTGDQRPSLPSIFSELEGQDKLLRAANRVDDTDMALKITAKITYAAANRLCLSVRRQVNPKNAAKDLVEPYAMAKSVAGNLVLIAKNQATARTELIELEETHEIELSSRTFRPSFSIEITAEIF